jgi:hypothetical protein
MTVAYESGHGGVARFVPKTALLMALLAPVTWHRLMADR